MKKTLLAFSMLILLAGSLAACQAGTKPLTIGEQDAGKTFTLKVGDKLDVELEGNITTGYTWVPAEQDPMLLTQLGEAEVTPESDAIGAGGMIVLHFEASATGETVLHLDYMRPWETGVAPEKSFEVTIIVE